MRKPDYNYEFAGLMITFQTDIKEKMWVETPGKTPGKTPMQILEILIDDPTLTIPEIAKMIKKSDSATERAIRKLREANLIKRIGPAIGGYWEVSIKDNN